MFIQFNHSPLTVDLPDFVEGQTVLKRKAVAIRLIYEAMTKFVNIKWLEKRYVKEIDGSAGRELGQVEGNLTAKDDILVDVTDGTQLCKLCEEYSSVEDGVDDANNTKYKQVLNPDLEGKNYAIESDFYDHIANAVPVVVNDLIEQRILKHYN